MKKRQSRKRLMQQYTEKKILTVENEKLLRERKKSLYEITD